MNFKQFVQKDINIIECSIISIYQINNITLANITRNNFNLKNNFSIFGLLITLFKKEQV